MMVHGGIGRLRRGVRVTAIGWGTATVLASAAVSACSGSTPSAGPALSSGGTRPASPSILSSATAQAVPPSSSPSPSPSPSQSPPASRAASPPAGSSLPPSASASPFPTAAPVTGGGGTAGLQNTLLITVGGVAMLAGAGSLAYRRKAARGR